ncbi:MAG: hypothetical protein KAI79_06065 [Bacteroidales bacterium]|nr:hypothetical protein [Bacteroidales bacterium]
MKQLTYILAIFVLLSINACKTSQNENNEPQEQVSIEKDTTNNGNGEEKVEFSAQTYAIPDILNYFPIEGPYLITTCRPIGWSEDGMFAYVLEPADEACGCYFLKLHIQNLKSDKIEWSFNYDKEIKNNEITIDSVWKNNDSLFTAKLNEYKIIQNKRFYLKTSNINNKGKNYFFNFKKETEFDDQYQIDWIVSSRLELTEQNDPENSLFSYKETAYEYILNTGLSGYLHSPYEDRVAFVIWQARWGYEGTPYVVNFKIIGTKLP